MHRYLKSNLSTYAGQCCITFKPYEPAATSEELGAVNPNSVLSLWVQDAHCGKSSLLYVLGAREGAEEKPMVGFLSVDAKELGNLYQDLQDLTRAFNESAQKSEEVFSRDKEKARPNYVSIVRRIGDLFAPRAATDETTAKIMVEKAVPEFTAENLKAIVDYVSMYGVNVEHKELCAILRLFHCVRYKLPLPATLQQQQQE